MLEMLMNRSSYHLREVNEENPFCRNIILPPVLTALHQQAMKLRSTHRQSHTQACIAISQLQFWGSNIFFWGGAVNPQFSISCSTPVLGVEYIFWGSEQSLGQQQQMFIK